MSNNENDEGSLRTFVIALVVAAIAMIAFLLPVPAESVDPIGDLIIEPVTHVEEAHAQEVEREVETSASVIRALVTGYNTVPEQTDSTPCIAATGDDICGRTDVVACPTAYPLGTQVVIDGKRYSCLDRTAAKFDGRFDISCDKDMDCPRRVHGYKEVQIIK